MLKAIKINNYLTDVFFPPVYDNETGFHRWIRWNTKNNTVVKSSFNFNKGHIESLKEVVKC